jgi:hypothetical protein
LFAWLGGGGGGGGGGRLFLGSPHTRFSGDTGPDSGLPHNNN